MTRIALVSVGLLFGAGLFAQQDPHFTMYMFNKQVLNPGYTGSKGVPYLQALYRNQWTGIEGAPKTINAGFHSPVGESQKVALGIYAIDDRLGVDHHTGVYGQYAYRMQLDRNAWMSMGIQAGATRYQAKLSDLIQPLWAYPTGDALVSTDAVGTWLPNVGVGVYLWGQQYFAGASIPHLINNQYDKDRDPNSVPDGRIAQQYRHFFAFAGFRFDVSPNFAFQPQVIVKYAAGDQIKIPFDADFDLGMILKDIIMFGVAYRLQDSFDAYFKAQITRSLELGYAYDLTVSELSEYTNGSHEIMIAYKLGTPPVTKIIGPRSPYWTF